MYSKVADENAEAPPAEEPFPWKLLTVLYCVIVSDAMALGIIMPFAPEMCKVQWGIDEKQVGIALSLHRETFGLMLEKLIGSFSMANFVSSWVIGYLSDLMGRKKLMLLGMLTGSLCTLGMGLSQWYWLALLFRAIAGLTNANAALSKAVISDVTTGKNRTLGFAYLGAAYSVARVISSAVGGATTGIKLPLPYVHDNAFFLPSALGAGFNLVSLFLAAYFIPETFKRDSDPLKKQHSMVVGLRYIASDGLMRNLLLGYALNSFTNGSLLLALVVFATTSIVNHGLGFTPLQMGLVFVWFGVNASIFQIGIFNRILRRLGILRTYLFALSVMVMGTLMVPVASLISWWFEPSQGVTIATWAHILVSLFLLAIGFMGCLPVVGSMISNATPADRQGITQGTSQSIAALFRSCGPMFSGMIFTFSVSIDFPFLLFWFLTSINFVCLYLMSNLTAENRKRIESGTQSEQEMRLLKGDRQQQENGKHEADIEDDDATKEEL